MPKSRLTGVDEHEADGRGHDEVGARFAADEEEPGTAVADDEANQIARKRLRRDVKKFAERLVKVLKPQLRRDLGGTKLQTEPRGAAVDFGQYALRALSYSATGKMEKARADVAKAVELEPAFSLTYYRKWNCYPNSPATKHEVAELRKMDLQEF